MKFNAWTVGLMGAGLVSLPAVIHAEEKPSSLLTALTATTISGYVDTSAQWNMGTGNANVPNYAFGGPGKADGFNLNVVKLSIEKPVDSADAWGAGYKVDLLFGPDANALATQSSGVAGDFGVKQAYVALHAPIGNGLDFKLGVWDTIIGYEVFESVNNPNVTRSYGYTVEPTTHTGLQAAYQFCESFSATVGIANTYGPTINGRAFLFGGTSAAGGQGPKAESYKTYMASMTFTAPTNWGTLGGSTLSACVINGFNSASPSGAADQTSVYVGATVNTPVTGLKVGAAYDWANVSGQPLTADVANHANVVGLYASYQLTEKLSIYGRGEYAWSTVPAPSTFLAKKVIEGTFTVQYDLWKNVMSRLEFRWDHAADDTDVYGGSTPGVGDKSNSYMLLANLAYKF
ncbi:MAG TPA: outer membrane beta-barrel protein [Candidatus Limnocylindrales bacterium]|nr:outer membrane beta-barrel protein [Candidatus Limnocylindrales bacterium]